MRCFYFQEYFVYFQFVLLLALTNMCAYNNIRTDYARHAHAQYGRCLFGSKPLKIEDWRIVYWTYRVSFSFVYMCVNQHTCAKLLICVVYLEISPAESPPTDNCIFFLRTVKK